MKNPTAIYLEVNVIYYSKAFSCLPLYTWRDGTKLIERIVIVNIDYNTINKLNAILSAYNDYSVVSSTSRKWIHSVMFCLFYKVYNLCESACFPVLRASTFHGEQILSFKS